MNNKIVIIVNGQGGVGKDTLCDYFCKCYKGWIRSSINPIKDIAKLCGWSGGKENKDRKFLSDLKVLCSGYSDTSFKYLQDEYEKFEDSDVAIMFVMIREPDEIDRFKKWVKHCDGRVATLLITRKGEDRDKKYGNPADDDVYDYSYDYIFENFSPVEAAQYDFVCFVNTIVNEN